MTHTNPLPTIKSLQLEKAVALIGQPQAKMVLSMVLALAFLILAIVFGLSYAKIARHNEAKSYIRSELNQIKVTQDYQAKIKRLRDMSAYSKSSLGSAPAELDYWLLLLDWKKGLDSFENLLSAQNNQYLKKDTSQLLRQVQKELTSLSEKCSDLIRNAENSESAAVLWKIYNLRGCASILKTFSLVEFDRNLNKTRSLLNDAINDYKKSIQLVDKTSLSPQDRLIPRWNMEMITGKGRLGKLSRQGLGQEEAREVFKQLEVVKPEELSGGYAPGVPRETQVEK